MNSDKNFGISISCNISNNVFYSEPAPSIKWLPLRCSIVVEESSFVLRGKWEVSIRCQMTASKEVGPIIENVFREEILNAWEIPQAESVEKIILASENKVFLEKSVTKFKNIQT